MAENQKIPKTFGIRFVKNTDFKTVHVSGAYGGVTGNGMINVNVYTDIITMPRVATFSVFPNGLLGQQISTDAPQEGTREVPFGMVMDINTAQSLMDWLATKIQEARLVIDKNIEHAKND